LLRKGGAIVVVNDLPWAWANPAHDGYRKFFETVIEGGHGGLDDFELFQDRFANDDTLNQIYRDGGGPAGVHAFYMYTWAAHGMDSVGKVFCVDGGRGSERAAKALGWERCGDVAEAIARARAWLGKPEAEATVWACPPVGYARVAGEGGSVAPAGA